MTDPQQDRERLASRVRVAALADEWEKQAKDEAPPLAGQMRGMANELRALLSREPSRVGADGPLCPNCSEATERQWVCERCGHREYAGEPSRGGGALGDAFRGAQWGGYANTAWVAAHMLRTGRGSAETREAYVTSLERLARDLRGTPPAPEPDDGAYIAAGVDFIMNGPGIEVLPEREGTPEEQAESAMRDLHECVEDIKRAVAEAKASAPAPTGGRKRMSEQGVEAMSRVLNERARQVSEEGWTAEHDAQHDSGELARAAAAYCLSPENETPGGYFENFPPPECWPWHHEWWKPGDRIRELEKAGALILAEIERLLRKEDDHD